MKQPRDHQQKAILAGLKHFSTNNRGKMIMACGTGKTLTSLWLAQKLGVKNLLVALPSLQLQEQIVSTWLNELDATGKFVLVIGSDKSISKIHSVLVTTSPAEIEQFLNLRGEKVIFTTYQSVDALAIACQNSKFYFDFGIMDEADVTAGVSGKPFSTLLTDECGVVIKKRLFMTATPRILAGEEVISMDNTILYGEEFYFLSTQESINLGILSEYQVLVIFLKKVPEKTSQQIAKEGLKKSIKQYGLKRVISYHSSISKAKEFSITMSEPDIECFHVNHTQKTKKRLEVIDLVKKSEKTALLTNSKALTFGFDLPETDCVAFIDSRSSVRDVVQSVGRALRKHPSKQMAYIFLPFIITENGWVDEMQFSSVRKALSAMASMDARVGDFFKRRGEKHNYPESIVRINYDDDVDFDENWLSENLQIRVWQSIRQLYWAPYEKAKQWVRQNLPQLTSETWRDYIAGKTNLPQLPIDIPKKPDKYYKNNGWEGWSVFLGRKNYNRLTYEEAVKWIKENKPEIQTKAAWYKFSKDKNFPDFLPKYPNETYKSEWVSWMSFLKGHSMINSWDYEKAKEWVKNNLVPSGITTVTKFRALIIDSDTLPAEIPKHPDKYYSRRGQWKGWTDFLSQ